MPTKIVSETVLKTPIAYNKQDKNKMLSSNNFEQRINGDDWLFHDELVYAPVDDELVRTLVDGALVHTLVDELVCTLVDGTLVDRLVDELVDTSVDHSNNV